MARLSPPQIATYARSAGFSGPALAIAVAVALAESSGDTHAHNSYTDRGQTYSTTGLWQISSIHQGSHPQWTVGWLRDPANNARAAYTLSGGGRKWTDWEAYTKGTYRQQGRPAAAQAATGFILPDGASDALGDPLIPDILPDLGQVADTAAALTSLAELALGAGKWLARPENWIRVGEVLVGGALVLGGLTIASRGAWQPAVDTGKKVAKTAIELRTRGMAAADKSPAGKAAKKGGGQNPLGAAKERPAAKKTAAKKAAPAKKAAAKKTAAPARKATAKKAAAKKTTSGPDPREALRR